MFGEAAIDQNHRDFPRRRFHHHVRPKFGLDEQCEIRLPMVEKTTHEPGNIKWNELVNHPALQALLGQAARCDSARSDQHAHPAGADSIDQRQNTRKLTDARAMQPDKRAFGTRNATFTTAFRQALPVFLAALESSGQENRSERSCRCGQQPIHPQTGRQFAAQGPLLLVWSAIS
jgi:hypothetical protein